MPKPTPPPSRRADTHLFDPTRYGPPPRPSRRRTTSPAVDEVTEAGWHVIGRRAAHPSTVVHRISFTNPHGAATAMCGLVGRDLDELPVGTHARLCAACIAETTSPPHRFGWDS